MLNIRDAQSGLTNELVAEKLVEIYGRCKM